MVYSSDISDEFLQSTFKSYDEQIKLQVLQYANPNS